MLSTVTLTLTLIFYGAGTAAVLTALVNRSARFQRVALALMMTGLIAHTVWISTVCIRTQHPPLTNLPEAASFIAWMILAAEIFLFFRYRMQAIAFLVYPLVLMLVTITAVVEERFVELDESLRSNLFIAHTFLSAVGVAALLIGLLFAALYYVQERSLRQKRRGAFYEWIPSLRLCDTLSYRSLSLGFVIYTLGLITGVLWAYRNAAPLHFRAKELAAVVAWMLFAALLQSFLSGRFRTRKNVAISAAAFVAIIVAVLGIQHG
jgi:ABC-type uncharacterized transport system permease subunit